MGMVKRIQISVNIVNPYLLLGQNDFTKRLEESVNFSENSKVKNESMFFIINSVNNNSFLR